jgi:hypothetical protein
LTGTVEYGRRAPAAEWTPAMNGNNDTRFGRNR